MRISFFVGSFSNPIKTRAEYFTRMSDEEVYFLAANDAVNNNKIKKQQKNTMNLIKAIPLIDSTIFATEKAAYIAPSLAITASHLGTRLLTWGALMGFSNIVSKGINKITAKSQTLTDFNEKHPAAKSIADIGVLLGSYSLAKTGISRLIKKIPEKNILEYTKKITSIRNKIDSSKLAEKVYTPLVQNIQNFMSKHTKLSGALKSITPYIIPAFFISTIIKASLIDPLRLKKKINNNYSELKTLQDFYKTNA